MRYFVNLNNMNKYASYPSMAAILEKYSSYIEVTKEEFDQLPYIF